MNDIKHHFSIYATLVREDQSLEAIERFYHDDIVQYENNEEPLEGKKLLRAKELAISKELICRRSQVTLISIDESDSRITGEMIFEFEGPNIGKRRLKENFVQIWDGALIKEQYFYYTEIEDIT